MTMKKVRISVYNVKPGMIAASDVYSANGQLLVPEDAVFSDESLAKMNAYSIPFVTIYLDEDSEEDIPPVDASYSERVRSSKDFAVFQQEFNNSLGDVNQSLQHIVTTSDDIDVDGLLQSTTAILSHNTTSIGVLDMINNLRNYDDSTYAHSLNVSIICRVFGQWLHMSDEDLDVLTVAGVLHDLGKLLMPPEIIKKPGKLTDEEFATIQKHPYLGYKHVENNSKLDPRIKAAMLMHHEKCDGSGYPSHLTLNNIHPFARIVAIADVYDAMTANRVYRDGMCPFHVIRMFEDEGYQKFDVQYLLPFLEGIVQAYINNRVRLTNGQIGEIVFINKQSLSRPIVRVGEQFIDLSNVHELCIEEIL
jgi:HD-GYP domain-containing protein (c-di-GMP phosphodiesterase class II)